MDTNKEVYIFKNSPQYEINKHFDERLKNEWNPKRINTA